MYCPKCGEKNNKDSKFCKICGQSLNLDEEITNDYKSDEEKDDLKRIKIISIIGLILSFLMPISIFGFILAITGLVFNSKYKKEYGTSSKYNTFNIVSLIICLLQLLIIVIVIVFAVLMAAKTDNTFVGKWNCGVSSSSYYNKYYVTTEFKRNGSFSWGKYLDVENNSYLGTYTYTKGSNSNLDRQNYSLTLNIDEYILNGKVQQDKSNIHEKLDAQVIVSDKGEKAKIMITTTGKMYYCERVN